MNHNYKDILHNVDLTEGQIGIILSSLEAYTLGRKDTDFLNDVDDIFKELEGSVDRFYDKLEKKQEALPDPMWTE